MDLMKRRKIFSFFVNLSLVFPVSFFSLLILSSPVASAQSNGSCDVPAVNDVTAVSYTHLTLPTKRIV